MHRTVSTPLNYLNNLSIYLVDNKLSDRHNDFSETLISLQLE